MIVNYFANKSEPPHYYGFQWACEFQVYMEQAYRWHAACDIVVIFISNYLSIQSGSAFVSTTKTCRWLWIMEQAASPTAALIFKFWWCVHMVKRESGTTVQCKVHSLHKLGSFQGRPLSCFLYSTAVVAWNAWEHGLHKTFNDVLIDCSPLQSQGIGPSTTCVSLHLQIKCFVCGRDFGLKPRPPSWVRD